ncbi:DNA cytosine methyltransferase [Corynebacterium sanguinis]|uniref:DNA cytosine methyltransferase n=1 Tax=Corynebacterium sanguinis TaxID=2594913 RepID=UPI0011A7CA14|nr:DNA cytosine methyltransferase [Corynebacterium sanguinis]MCT2048023.1 DNA cytosine methyltransferase [Corynebacterium sanguinis]MDN8577940.1 DNA cytosine methyltransferase [Corynebacterium sanguinis]TVS24728.1 DNA cytosine methyltransferase [Corynebacterium sanguinis]
MSFRGVELFAGGGGLLLGSALAGVEHVAAVEWNKWACQTMRENARDDYPLVRGLRVLEGDVQKVDWDELTAGRDVDIVTGGPPCQPFSLGGLARNADDPRDMFPAATAVIEKLRPKAFVLENVRGLARPSFSDYLEFIKLRLSHPEIVAMPGENWREHLTRLQKEHTSARSGLEYNLVTTIVDAADYGVPQHRHRLFIVGFRSDIDAGWSFPEATHSGSALALSQMQGVYWERMGVAKKERIPISRVPREDGLLPWVTVRQALTGLPDPRKNRKRATFLDHDFKDGARSYPGHTGSPLDAPSKALKAGVHGVPGGENMIRYPDGTVRYYTVREAARIQTFPDGYALHGAWTEALRQLGNAVPVALAETVLSSVTEHLALHKAKQAAFLQTSRRHLRVVS